MSTGKLLLYLSLYLLLAGCQPVSMQSASMQSAFNPNSYPPPQLGSGVGNQPYGIYPGSTQSQPQAHDAPNTFGRKLCKAWRWAALLAGFMAQEVVWCLA